MKYITPIAFLYFLLFANVSFAQVVPPATLSYAVSKNNYKAGDTVYLIINVKMAEGWSLYSSEFKADGPIKFNCTLSKSSNYTPAGPIEAYKPFAHFDEVWEEEVKIFENIGQFRIPVIVKKAGKIMIKAEIEGQACKDACAPIADTIELDLSTLPVSDYIAADPAVYKHYEEHSKTEEGHK